MLKLPESPEKITDNITDYVQILQGTLLQYQGWKGTVHLNGTWNEYSFQGHNNVVVRSCSQFEVWSGSPSATSPTPLAPSPPSVLLFGFAGSKKHQLEKHSKLYNELGYQTLFCILPLQNLFHYDVHKIRCKSKTRALLIILVRDCANWVLDAAAREGMERVVCHSFSNNGAALYQQFTHMVAQQGDVSIAIVSYPNLLFSLYSPGKYCWCCVWLCSWPSSYDRRPFPIQTNQRPWYSKAIDTGTYINYRLWLR